MTFAFIVTYIKRVPGKKPKKATHSEVNAPSEKDARLALVEEYNRRGYKVIKIEEAEKNLT